jgi:MFS family permease
MALFCFTLPHTPPAKTGVSPFAFAKAFALLRKPQVSLFFLVSFLVGVAFYFYFTLVGPYLAHVGADSDKIPALQSIGNFSEIPALLLLALCLKHWGPSITIALGALFGALRYAVFALGEPYELVIGALFTHGFYFTFFFVVGFIYIDMVAPKDIKGSAQGLLTLVVFGLSAWLGNMFIGVVQKTYEGRPDAWAKVWLVPALIAIACAILFLITFPKGSMKKATGTEETPEKGAEEPPPSREAVPSTGVPGGT